MTTWNNMKQTENKEQWRPKTGGKIDEQWTSIESQNTSYWTMTTWNNMKQTDNEEQWRPKISKYLPAYGNHAAF